MKKLTAKALAALMACTMIPATLPIVSNAEVNDVIDGTSAVLYSHDASDRPSRKFKVFFYRSSRFFD